MNELQPALIKMHEALEPTPDLRKNARAVANQFEAIFVQSMVASMRKTGEMGGDQGMFGKGPGTGTYTQWFDNHMATFLAKNGHIGLSDTLMKEFERLKQIPDAEQTAKENQLQ